MEGGNEHGVKPGVSHRSKLLFLDAVFPHIGPFCHSQNSAFKNWKHFAGLNELIQHTLARRRENSKWRLCPGASAFRHIIESQTQQAPYFVLLNQAKLAPFHEDEGHRIKPRYLLASILSSEKWLKQSRGDRHLPPPPPHTYTSLSQGLFPGGKKI